MAVPEGLQKVIQATIPPNGESSSSVAVLDRPNDEKGEPIFEHTSQGYRAKWPNTDYEENELTIESPESKYDRLYDERDALIKDMNKVIRVFNAKADAPVAERNKVIKQYNDLLDRIIEKDNEMVETGKLFNYEEHERSYENPENPPYLPLEEELAVEPIEEQSVSPKAEVVKKIEAQNNEAAPLPKNAALRKLAHEIRGMTKRYPESQRSKQEAQAESNEAYRRRGEAILKDFEDLEKEAKETDDHLEAELEAQLGLNKPAEQEGQSLEIAGKSLEELQELVNKIQAEINRQIQERNGTSQENAALGETAVDEKETSEKKEKPEKAAKAKGTHADDVHATPHDKPAHPERAKAPGKAVPVREVEDKGTEIKVNHDQIEILDEDKKNKTWTDLRREAGMTTSQQKPDKDGRITWDEYKSLRPGEGVYPDKSGRARDAKTGQFADPTEHRKALVGEEHYQDYDYVVSKQSQAYYDKLNNIENENNNQSEVLNYKKMPLTKLARELAEVQYKYHKIEGGKESDLEEAGQIEKEIREAALKQYRKKAKASGDPELINNYENEMENFESMADRFLRAKLEDEILKTQEGKETLKSATKRWWSGVKNRFGVSHWEKNWNASDKKSAALHKDVVEDEPWEERERKKKENRYHTIIGRSVIFAQSPKTAGREAVTWDIHKKELLRDYGDLIDERRGRLELKADSDSLSSEDKARRAEAQRQLEIMEKLRDRTKEQPPIPNLLEAIGFERGLY